MGPDSRHIRLSTGPHNNTLTLGQTKTAIIIFICQKGGSEKLCAPFPQRKQNAAPFPKSKRRHYIQTLISNSSMEMKTEDATGRSSASRGLHKRVGAQAERDGGSAGCAPRLQMPRRGRGHSVRCRRRQIFGSRRSHELLSSSVCCRLDSVSGCAACEPCRAVQSCVGWRCCCRWRRRRRCLSTWRRGCRCSKAAPTESTLAFRWPSTRPSTPSPTHPRSATVGQFSFIYFCIVCFVFVVSIYLASTLADANYRAGAS
jgi:hypothetical protein